MTRFAILLLSVPLVACAASRPAPVAYVPPAPPLPAKSTITPDGHQFTVVRTPMDESDPLAPYKVIAPAPKPPTTH